MYLSSSYTGERKVKWNSSKATYQDSGKVIQELALRTDFFPRDAGAMVSRYNYTNTIHDTSFVLTNCTVMCLTCGNITVQREGMRAERAGFSRRDLLNNLGQHIWGRLCLFLLTCKNKVVVVSSVKCIKNLILKNRYYYQKSLPPFSFLSSDTTVWKNVTV